MQSSWRNIWYERYLRTLKYEVIWLGWQAPTISSSFMPISIHQVDKLTPLTSRKFLQLEQGCPWSFPTSLPKYNPLTYFQFSCFGNGTQDKKNSLPSLSCWSPFSMLWAFALLLTSMWKTAFKGSETIKKSYSRFFLLIDPLSDHPVMTKVSFTSIDSKVFWSSVKNSASSSPPTRVTSNFSKYFLSISSRFLGLPSLLTTT